MSGAKTEEATPKRLQRAREEGDTGASVFASQAIGLVAAIAVLPSTAAAVAARVEEQLHDAFRRAASHDVFAHLNLDLAKVATTFALLLSPVLLATAVASSVSTIVQAGGPAGARRFVPRLDRLNPFAGLARLVTRAHIFSVVRAIVLGGAVAWLAAAALREHAVDVVRTSGRLELAGWSASAIARAIGWQAALIGLAIAALDVIVMRADWRRRNRMARSEVQRELKESGSDPHAAERRKRARVEAAAHGALASVRLASLVVAAGSRAAYALRYAAGDRAPVMLASGEGKVAEEIVRAARRFNVTVADDAAVAGALADVAVGETIPEAIYDAVAALLRDGDGAPDRE